MSRLPLLLLVACAAGNSVRVAEGMNVVVYVSADPNGHHAHPAQVSEAQVRAALLRDGNLVDAQIASIAQSCARQLAEMEPDHRLLIKSGVELALFVEDDAIIVGRLSGDQLTTRTRVSIAKAPPSEMMVIAPPSQPTTQEPRGSEREQARKLYDSGIAHYNLGEIREALGDFKNAYRLVHEPVLLFNIAQCHRRLNQWAQAAELYRGFLREAPNASNRADVERFIQEADRAAGQ